MYVLPVDAIYSDSRSMNIGLLLFGDVGTGKSFAAGCIANALLDRDVPVLMTNFPVIGEGVAVEVAVLKSLGLAPPDTLHALAALIIA